MDVPEVFESEALVLFVEIDQVTETSDESVIVDPAEPTVITGSLYEATAVLVNVQVIDLAAVMVPDVELQEPKEYV